MDSQEKSTLSNSVCPVTEQSGAMGKQLIYTKQDMLDAFRLMSLNEKLDTKEEILFYVKKKEEKKSLDEPYLQERISREDMSTERCMDNFLEVKNKWRNEFRTDPIQSNQTADSQGDLHLHPQIAKRQEGYVETDTFNDSFDTAGSISLKQMNKINIYQSTSNKLNQLFDSCLRNGNNSTVSNKSTNDVSGENTASNNRNTANNMKRNPVTNTKASSFTNDFNNVMYKTNISEIIDEGKNERDMNTEEKMNFKKMIRNPNNNYAENKRHGWKGIPAMDTSQWRSCKTAKNSNDLNNEEGVLDSSANFDNVPMATSISDDNAEKKSNYSHYFADMPFSGNKKGHDKVYSNEVINAYDSTYRNDRNKIPMTRDTFAANEKTSASNVNLESSLNYVRNSNFNGLSNMSNLSNFSTTNKNCKAGTLPMNENIEDKDDSANLQGFANNGKVNMNITSVYNTSSSATGNKHFNSMAKNSNDLGSNAVNQHSGNKGYGKTASPNVLKAYDNFINSMNANNEMEMDVLVKEVLKGAGNTRVGNGSNSNMSPVVNAAMMNNNTRSNAYRLAGVMDSVNICRSQRKTSENKKNMCQLNTATADKHMGASDQWKSRMQDSLDEEERISRGEPIKSINQTQRGTTRDGIYRNVAQNQNAPQSKNITQNQNAAGVNPNATLNKNRNRIRNQNVKNIYELEEEEHADFFLKKRESGNENNNITSTNNILSSLKEAIAYNNTSSFNEKGEKNVLNTGNDTLSDTQENRMNLAERKLYKYALETNRSDIVSININKDTVGQNKSIENESMKNTPNKGMRWVSSKWGTPTKHNNQAKWNQQRWNSSMGQTSQPMSGMNEINANQINNVETKNTDLPNVDVQTGSNAPSINKTNVRNPRYMEKGSTKTNEKEITADDWSNVRKIPDPNAKNQRNDDLMWYKMSEKLNKSFSKTDNNTTSDSHMRLDSSECVGKREMNEKREVPARHTADLVDFVNTASLGSSNIQSNMQQVKGKKTNTNVLNSGSVRTYNIKRNIDINCQSEVEEKESLGNKETAMSHRDFSVIENDAFSTNNFKGKITDKYNVRLRDETYKEDKYVVNDPSESSAKSRFHLTTSNNEDKTNNRKFLTDIEKERCLYQNMNMNAQTNMNIFLKRDMSQNISSSPNTHVSKNNTVDLNRNFGIISNSSLPDNAVRTSTGRTMSQSLIHPVNPNFTAQSNNRYMSQSLMPSNNTHMDILQSRGVIGRNQCGGQNVGCESEVDNNLTKKNFMHETELQKKMHRRDLYTDPYITETTQTNVIDPDMCDMRLKNWVASFGKCNEMDMKMSQDTALAFVDPNLKERINERCAQVHKNAEENDYICGNTKSTVSMSFAELLNAMKLSQLPVGKSVNNAYLRGVVPINSEERTSITEVEKNEAEERETETERKEKKEKEGEVRKERNILDANRLIVPNLESCNDIKQGTTNNRNDTFSNPRERFHKSEQERLQLENLRKFVVSNIRKRENEHRVNSITNSVTSNNSLSSNSLANSGRLNEEEVITTKEGSHEKLSLEKRRRGSTVADMEEIMGKFSEMSHTNAINDCEKNSSCSNNNNSIANMHATHMGVKSCGKIPPDIYYSIAKMKSPLDTSTFLEVFDRLKPSGNIWEYKDLVGNVQGPFSVHLMFSWWAQNFFHPHLPIRFSKNMPWIRLERMFPPNTIPFVMTKEIILNLIEEVKDGQCGRTIDYSACLDMLMEISPEGERIELEETKWRIDEGTDGKKNNTREIEEVKNDYASSTLAMINLSPTGLSSLSQMSSMNLMERTKAVKQIGGGSSYEQWETQTGKASLKGNIKGLVLDREQLAKEIQNIEVEEIQKAKEIEELKRLKEERKELLEKAQVEQMNKVHAEKMEKMGHTRKSIQTTAEDNISLGKNNNNNNNSALQNRDTKKADLKKEIGSHVEQKKGEVGHSTSSATVPLGETNTVVKQENKSDKKNDTTPVLENRETKEKNKPCRVNEKGDVAVVYATEQTSSEVKQDIAPLPSKKTNRKKKNKNVMQLVEQVPKLEEHTKEENEETKNEKEKNGENVAKKVEKIKEEKAALKEPTEKKVKETEKVVELIKTNDKEQKGLTGTQTTRRENGKEENEMGKKAKGEQRKEKERRDKEAEQKESNDMIVGGKYNDRISGTNEQMNEDIVERISKQITNKINEQLCKITKDIKLAKGTGLQGIEAEEEIEKKRETKSASITEKQGEEEKAIEMENSPLFEEVEEKEDIKKKKKKKKKNKKKGSNTNEEIGSLEDTKTQQLNQEVEKTKGKETKVESDKTKVESDKTKVESDKTKGKERGKDGKDGKTENAKDGKIENAKDVGKTNEDVYNAEGTMHTPETSNIIAESYAEQETWELPIHPTSVEIKTEVKTEMKTERKKEKKKWNLPNDRKVDKLTEIMKIEEQNMTEQMKKEMQEKKNIKEIAPPTPKTGWCINFKTKEQSTNASDFPDLSTAIKETKSKQKGLVKSTPSKIIANTGETTKEKSVASKETTTHKKNYTVTDSPTTKTKMPQGTVNAVVATFKESMSDIIKKKVSVKDLPNGVAIKTTPPKKNSKMESAPTEKRNTKKIDVKENNTKENAAKEHLKREEGLPNKDPVSNKNKKQNIQKNNTSTKKNTANKEEKSDIWNEKSWIYNSEDEADKGKWVEVKRHNKVVDIPNESPRKKEKHAMNNQTGKGKKNKTEKNNQPCKKSENDNDPFEIESDFTKEIIKVASECKIHLEDSLVSFLKTFSGPEEVYGFLQHSVDDQEKLHYFADEFFRLLEKKTVQKNKRRKKKNKQLL